MPAAFAENARHRGVPELGAGAVQRRAVQEALVVSPRAGHEAPDERDAIGVAVAGSLLDGAGAPLAASDAGVAIRRLLALRQTAGARCTALTARPSRAAFSPGRAATLAARSRFSARAAGRRARRRRRVCLGERQILGQTRGERGHREGHGKDAWSHAHVRTIAS